MVASALDFWRSASNCDALAPNQGLRPPVKGGIEDRPVSKTVSSNLVFG